MKLQNPPDFCGAVRSAPLTWPLRAVAGALCVAALSACVSAPADPQGLNPQAARITDARIQADRMAMDALQQRLNKLNQSGIPVKSYNFAKAQCWLDTAKAQYHENDRTRYIEESLAQSQRIVSALETDGKAAPLVTDTPLVARSHKLREDLWSKLASQRAQPHFSCAAQNLACAEVLLVRAGHADEQTGWRQANPYIGMAEDAIRQADRQMAACNPPPAPATPVAANVPAPAPAVVSERIELSADGLFEFDQSGWQHLLPHGKERLVQLAQKLKGYRAIDAIVINGYTDRLGSAAHNQQLSQARAQTVKQYLESQGVTAARFVAQGQGASNPVTGDRCASSLPRAAQIACLLPDRRVELEVIGKN